MQAITKRMKTVGAATDSPLFLPEPVEPAQHAAYATEQNTPSVAVATKVQDASETYSALVNSIRIPATRNKTTSNITAMHDDVSALDIYISMQRMKEILGRIALHIKRPGMPPQKS